MVLWFSFRKNTTVLSTFSCQIRKIKPHEKWSHKNLTEFLYEIDLDFAVSGRAYSHKNRFPLWVFVCSLLARLWFSSLNCSNQQRMGICFYPFHLLISNIHITHVIIITMDRSFLVVIVDYVFVCVMCFVSAQTGTTFAVFGHIFIDSSTLRLFRDVLNKTNEKEIRSEIS